MASILAPALSSTSTPVTGAAKGRPMPVSRDLTPALSTVGQHRLPARADRSSRRPAPVPTKAVTGGAAGTGGAETESAPVGPAVHQAPVRTAPVAPAEVHTARTTTYRPRHARQQPARSAWSGRSNGWSHRSHWSAASMPPPAVSGSRSAVLAFALSQVGQRYRFGGSGNGGWDCSGLVSAAYRRIGISLPHSSDAIGDRGQAVPNGQWQPGDVIASSGHVALYLGHGMMVEAANPRAGVRVTTVRGGHARRF